MIKNYLKITLRNLWKNKIYFFINLVGLAVAVATCIIAYLNYRYHEEYNMFHTQAHSIYKVNGIRSLNGQDEGVSISPLPLGNVMREQLSSVRNIARVKYHSNILRVGRNTFQQKILYADPEFLDMFTFPLKYGDPRNFKDPNQILLSEETALRLFGTVNPVGESLQVLVGAKSSSYVVGGVLEKIPLNSSLKFDALHLIDHYLNQENIQGEDWGSWVHATFIQLSSPQEVGAIEQTLQKYLAVQGKNSEELKLKAFYLSPLTQMKNSELELYRSVFQIGMGEAAIWGLLSSALLTLLLACFNFTNMSIALSKNRLKEIGIRKVMGGTRRQLITQFLCENILILLLSIIVGLAFAELLLPQFRSIFPFVDIHLDYSKNISLWAFLFVLLLFVSLLAGYYPAFYLSRFQAVAVFKGKSRLGGINLFTKILLFLQLSITVYNLAFSFAFYQNTFYQAGLDRGYDWQNLLVIPIQEEGQYISWKNRLSRDTRIEYMTGAKVPIGFGMEDYTITYRGQEYPTRLIGADEHYIPTHGLRIVKGKDFIPDQKSFKDILVNEQLVREMGWVQAIGQKLQLQGQTRYVRGVVKNFHPGSFTQGNEVGPVVIHKVPIREIKYLILRGQKQELAAIQASIARTWETVAPNEPYAGFYQEDISLQEKYINEIMLTIDTYFALIAIIISLLSLYTMISLSIMRRIKEVGIRKILGAEAQHIIQLLTKDYVYLMIFASLVGTISGYYVVDFILDVIFTYRMKLGWINFIAPILMMFCLAALAVGGKIYQVTKINPVDYLRNE